MSVGKARRPHEHMQQSVTTAGLPDMAGMDLDEESLLRSTSSIQGAAVGLSCLPGRVLGTTRRPRTQASIRVSRTTLALDGQGQGVDVLESNMQASDLTAMDQRLIWILLLVDPKKMAEKKFTKVKIRVNEEISWSPQINVATLLIFLT